MTRTRVLAALLAAALAIGAPAAAASTTPLPPPGPATPAATATGRLVVKLEVPPRDVAATAAELAALVGGRLEGEAMPATVVLEVGAAHASAAAEVLRDRPEVAWVEADQVVEAERTPNDPCLRPCVAGSGSSPSGYQWALSTVGASEAWERTTGSASVTVAVLDSGVDAAHPDLGGKVVVGTTFSGSPNTADPSGHGTHVIGVVAAATDNATGVAGLGWDTRVLSVKVLGDDGSGLGSWVARGLRYAVDSGAKVVNVSLAATTSSQLMVDAVAYAQDRDVVVVAATGNAGTTAMSYPAAYPYVVSVAASDIADQLTAFSNRGSSWVDLAAPGQHILSTVPGGGVGSWSGTSVASPHVAATAALIRGARPDLSAPQVIDAILSSTAPLGAPAGAVARGRLDTAAAVATVVPLPIPPPVPPAPVPPAPPAVDPTPTTPIASAPPLPAPVTRGPGYWMVATDGGIFSFGAAAFYGSTGAIKLNRPIVGMAPTPSGNGYWMVASDGGIFAFGDAGFFGSTGAIRLNRPIVGMAASPSGRGYWLVATDGGIFAFGDAAFYGSTGAIKLNRPIVGMAASPSGRGYWLAATDGGIFAFGDAGFFGSTGAIALAQPIVAITSSPSGAGYRMVAADGGIFSFGDAPFYGSAAGASSAPVVSMAGVTGGYWSATAAGGVAAFGSAPFLGALPTAPGAPVVGVAALPR